MNIGLPHFITTIRDVQAYINVYVYIVCVLNGELFFFLCEIVRQKGCQKKIIISIAYTSSESGLP